MPETRGGERAYRTVFFTTVAALAKGCVTVPGGLAESSNIFSGRHWQTVPYAQLGRIYWKSQIGFSSSYRYLGKFGPLLMNPPL
jgi:hypothetical protein